MTAKNNLAGEKMKCSLHNHTVFCDGNSTHEEMVKAAIDLGFCSIGFSGHGYTKDDLRYCMTDTEGYIAETLRVKEKYKEKIQVYLGLEEDARQPCDRNRFDYIIGSSHYCVFNGEYYDVDESLECFKTGFAASGNSVEAYAEEYYSRFCEYLLRRKPDIAGHFDLLTKYEQMWDGIFLGNGKYEKIAEKYLLQAIKSGCIFEVNTGAISRGYRTEPYPSLSLLHILNKNGAAIIINTDCHNAEKMNCGYDRAVELVKQAGFREHYVMYDGKFQSVKL